MRYSGSTNGVTESGSLNAVSSECSRVCVCVCTCISLDADSGCDVDDYTQETIALLNYNPNSTDAGCTIYEMVNSAMSANVKALLMMRTQDDPFSLFPPNARIYSKLKYTCSPPLPQIYYTCV